MTLKALPILPFLLLAVSVGTSQERERDSTKESDLLDVAVWGFQANLSVTESLLEFQDVVEYVQSRIGVPADVIPGPITVFFEPADTNPCRLRGLAVMAERDPSISIFIDDDTSREQILGVLAHELGHFFQVFGVQGGRSVEGWFNEGFPTWAAGRYWLEWHGTPSWQAAVARYLDSDTFISLPEINSVSESPGDVAPEDCMARRDTIYTEWAAFIDFLLETYGQERFDALFRSASNAKPELQASPNIASDAASLAGLNKLPERRLLDFEGTYGKSLERLESEWLTAIRNSE